MTFAFPDLMEIFAVPRFFAFITPFEETDATLGLEEL